MTAPNFYIVVDGNAYALDDDGVPFGAPVFEDNTIDWDQAYDFDPCDEDIEYVAHMCKMLQDMKALTVEQNSEVFVK